MKRHEVIRQAKDAARAALVSSSSSGSAGDHLGDLAWWDPVSGFRRPVQDVHQELVARGLDPVATLPPSPTWVTAFGRAVQTVRARLQERNLTLLDAAAGPSGERRVSVVEIARNGVVTTADVGCVSCPKDGNRPMIERVDPHGVTGAILSEATAYFDVYTSDDVRSGIVATFARWAAMPCRQAPPHIVYWIPPAAGETVRKLADAVEALGWGRIELFAGYRGDERSARACVNAVNGGLEARLSEFAKEVQAYASRDPNKTRISTIETKIEDASRLRQQGALYREILGAAVVQIDSRIGEIERSLRDTLGLVEAAHNTTPSAS